MVRYVGERLAARPQWLERRERGSALAMRLLAWLSFVFGRRVGRVLLYPVCAYFLLFSRHARRASREYLRRVLDRRPRLGDLFRHYYAFASTVHDRLFLLAGRHREFAVDVHIAPQAERWLNGKGGCILLGAHFGSFEMLRAYGAAHHGRPINVMMHLDNALKSNRVMGAITRQFGLRIIPVGNADSLLRVRECLLRGEAVGILADRMWNNDRSVRCDFLGGPARFPVGPLLLAALLESPVVLFSAVYQGGNRYEVRLEPFAERISLDRGAREAALQHWIQRYAHTLEQYCRRAPYNWFNFYDFWA